MKTEKRFLPTSAKPVHLIKREDGDDGPSTIQGYAAVFDDGTEATEFHLWGNTFERIMPGAFNRALAEKHDVRALFNHDSNQLLGRASAGTLDLTVDSTGLAYSITPPDTTVGRDVSENLRVGNVTGSSFAFVVTNETWRIDEDGREIREINDVDLIDVGPVTFPAYTETTAGVRSAGESGEAKASHEKWRGELAAQQAARRRRRQRAFTVKSAVDDAE